jgi:hypothetical protein
MHRQSLRWVTSCKPFVSISGLLGGTWRPVSTRCTSAMKNEPVAASVMKDEPVTLACGVTGMRLLGPALASIGALPLRTASAKEVIGETLEGILPSEDEGLECS